MSLTQFQLDITKINEKPKLYVCKPDRYRTTVGILSDAFSIKWNPKISSVSELSFNILTKIEINHKLVNNPNYDLLKYKYLIRYHFMDIVEYFVINVSEDSSDESTFIKTITCYSMAFNLSDEIITYSNTNSYSKNAEEMLNILLENTIWNVDSINIPSIFKTTYLQFDFNSKSCLECIYDIANAFNATVYFDTVNYLIGLSNNLTDTSSQDYILNSTNYPLVFDYGKYINTINYKLNPDSFCTWIEPRGKGNITINSSNITGQSGLMNFQFFLYPFQRDPITKEVIQSSYYMSDNLCNSILDFEELTNSYKGQFESLISQQISLQDSLNTANTTLASLNTTILTILDSLYIAQSNNQTSIISDLINQRNNAQIDINNKKMEINNCQFTIEVNNIATNTGSFSLAIDDTNIITVSVNANDDANIIATNIYNLLYNTYYNSNNNYPLSSNMICNTTDSIVTVNYLTTKSSEDVNLVFSDIDNTGVMITFGEKTNIGIENKLSDILNQMSIITNALSMENNFSEDDMFELKQSFIKKKQIRNDYIDDPKILYQWSLTEFSKYYLPPTILDIKLIDLFQCLDVGCQIDKRFVKLNQIVKVKYPMFNIDVKCVITELSIDFESSDVNVVLSNIGDIIRDKDKLLKLLNQTISSSVTLENSKDDWNKITTANNSIANTIDILQGKVKGDINLAVNETVELGSRGLVITDANDSKKVLRGIAGTIACSDDGGESYKNALTTRGLVAESVYGTILAGENLTIDASSSDGTHLFTVDGNGFNILNMILTLLRSDNKTRILLDPTVGFSIQKNTGTVETPVWSDVLYINNDGDLVTTGNIVIGSGTNNVLHVDENGIYLGSNTFSDAPFRVNLSGDMVAESATVEGNMNVTGSLKIQGTDILDTIDNVKTINGQYLSSNSIGSSKIIDLNADKISAGTITGSTIKTGATGSTRVELKSTFADIDLYHGSTNILKIYDGVDYAQIYSPANSLWLGSSGTNVIAKGTWDFSGATTNIVAKFK